MADPFPIRRTLRMHPPHQFVGVRGFEPSAGGYAPTEDFSPENPEAQPPNRDGLKPEGDGWDQVPE